MNGEEKSLCAFCLELKENGFENTSELLRSGYQSIVGHKWKRRIPETLRQIISQTSENRGTGRRENSLISW